MSLTLEDRYQIHLNYKNSAIRSADGSVDPSHPDFKPLTSDEKGSLLRTHQRAEAYYNAIERTDLALEDLDEFIKVKAKRGFGPKDLLKACRLYKNIAHNFEICREFGIDSNKFRALSRSFDYATLTLHDIMEIIKSRHSEK